MGNAARQKVLDRYGWSRIGERLDLLGGPEVALIADLGGGTSDFTVMRLGTGHTGEPHSGERREDILATGGVQVAGDSFNASLMARRLTKYFGAGTTYRAFSGDELPFPSALLATVIGRVMEDQITLVDSGEATAVFRIYPRRDGTELDLRNGTVLLVPGSVNLPANLREGVWIEVTVRREGNRNVVRSLDVLQEGPVSHG